MTNNRAGRYEYHHKNALGSNIVLTDGKKNVLARYEYDVFGAVRSETGTSTNVRKFTGKEYEADVKLYYYSARYYDPYIGRFTSRNPIGDGINWYAYATNNTNSDNKSLINICRVIVGGASLPRLFPLNAQKAENEIAQCVSDRNATFLFRNGITR